MTKTVSKTTRNNVIYWIATLWLGSGMISSGVLQLAKAKVDGHLSPPGVFGITHLGYPVYFLTILGVWKLLGMAALFVPKFPLLKEWAYAGFFFVVTGAIYSHLAVGDPPKELFPASVLLIMTVLSWYFRPAERKIAALNQYGSGKEFVSLKTVAEKYSNQGAAVA